MGNLILDARINGHLTLRRGVDLFLGATAAAGASPKTLTWYRMILMRAVAAFAADDPVDRLTGADVRAWLVERRTTLAAVSVAGYVRTLKVFGTATTLVDRKTRQRPNGPSGGRTYGDNSAHVLLTPERQMDRCSLASGLLKELCKCRDPIRR